MGLDYFSRFTKPLQRRLLRAVETAGTGTAPSDIPSDGSEGPTFISHPQVWPLRLVAAFEALVTRIANIAAGGGGGGGIANGDKGDIVVTNDGLTWTIEAGAVSTSKMGGDVTAAGKALLDDANAAAQRTTLGLGTAATQASSAFALASHTHAISDVTNLQTELDAKVDDSQISAFGATLIDDADAAAARTTLGLGTAATSSSGAFAAASHTHAISDVTGLQTALDNKLDDSQATAAGLAILGGADAAAQRTSLGLGTAATAASSSFATASHTHAASDVTSGTFDAARLPAATTSTAGAVELATDGETAANVVVQGNDARLSNARTPTSHDHAGNKLAQANTHESPDTDSATSALHHTLGTGANQAAAGNHTHAQLHDAATVLDTDTIDFGISGQQITGSVRLQMSVTSDASGVRLSGDSASPGNNFRYGTNSSGTKGWYAANQISTIFVGAGEMIPRTTTGCGVGSYESSTNRVNYDTMEFDTATNEFANFIRVLPSNWNAGTLTARFYWTAASGSGTAIFGLQAFSFGDNVALDTAFGTAQTATDTLQTAGNMHISPATSAITIGGTPAVGIPVIFQVYRDTSDTLGVDALLLGIEITYTPA